MTLLSRLDCFVENLETKFTEFIQLKQRFLTFFKPRYPEVLSRYYLEIQRHPITVFSVFRFIFYNLEYKFKKNIYCCFIF